MRVGLVTNWDEKCAVAEYARNLTEYCLAADKDVSFKIIGRPLMYQQVWEEIKDVDVVHFNYCAHAFKQITNDEWKNFRTIKPTVMTIHESSDYFVRRLAKSELVDAFVMHDKFRDGMPAPRNVWTIPYGVPEIDTSDVKVEEKVGTFGCAFPWKGLLPLAHACATLKVPLQMWLSEPDSDKGQLDWQRLKTEILEICPWAQISTEWLQQEKVIRELASCSVISLPFDPSSPIMGISSSVRLALAAKRPLVLTNFFHFADLRGWTCDSIWWIEDGQGLQHALEMAMSEKDSQVISSYKDMKWSFAANEYIELYKKVTRGKSVCQTI